VSVRSRLIAVERKAAALPRTRGPTVDIPGLIEELTERYAAGGFDVWAADYLAANAEHGLDRLMSAREVWLACERAAEREASEEPEVTN
jgi:hypothetical protein